MPRLGVVWSGLGGNPCLHVAVVCCFSSTLRDGIEIPKGGILIEEPIQATI